MKYRSLVPFREGGALARPDAAIFGSLQREIDRLFEGFSGLSATNGSAMGLAPRMDVMETDKAIEITAEMPGLERKDVEISLEDDVLTIRGEKKVEEQKKDANKNYHVSERSYGVFYRVIQLPMKVDPSTVEATMSKGVLKIAIPKPPQTEAKKIEVKEAA